MPKPVRRSSQPPLPGGFFVSPRLFAALLPLLVLLQCATALSQPKLVLVDGPSFAYGEIVAGARPSRVVRLRNDGTDTLRITTLSAKCGCASWRILTRSIPPGESGAVELTYASDYDRGAVRKNVSIFSNDPEARVTMVWFSAQVVSYLEVKPRVLVFSRAESVAMTPKEITVTNRDTAAVTIRALADSASLVKAEASGIRIGPGRSASLRLTSRSVGALSREGTVVIRSDSPRQGELKMKYIIEGAGKP